MDFFCKGRGTCVPRIFYVCAVLHGFHVWLVCFDSFFFSSGLGPLDLGGGRVPGKLGGGSTVPLLSPETSTDFCILFFFVFCFVIFLFVSRRAASKMDQ